MIFRCFLETFSSGRLAGVVAMVVQCSSDASINYIYKKATLHEQLQGFFVYQFV